MPLPIPKTSICLKTIPNLDNKICNKHSGIVTDRSYAEVKEIVGGYIIVKANDIDEAIKLGEGCPILYIGGHVEVRDIMQKNP